ncbi:class I SAM-dependent methyltransferase [Psychromicrobium lacuslunae]|uniref:Methyltransferase n=1 Tax=Psychromicrobium lacuslunae TaxID=1618207 RepID=A0A0D4BZD5_9MICC|nr:class I SAM-dependent methyltransferase [Psychromicrobium lacuslunae]AJT41486.1 methyltransferase [Psychromicrobium lacuslunae]
MEPSAFYTGIVAEIYQPLKSTVQDWRPYLEFIRRYGEPALELGCGDGEPMLDLLRRGIDVEGVDSSPDMLDRFRGKASGEGVRVTLYEQSMEALELPKLYRSVYLAGPTFTLLPDDSAAQRTLLAIRRHLAQDGAVLIPLSIPVPTPLHQLGEVKEVVSADGAVLRVSWVAEERDEELRNQTALLRYQKISADQDTTVERSWRLHWYTQEGFRELAVQTGFKVQAVLSEDGMSAAVEATDFTFLLRAV